MSVSLQHVAENGFLARFRGCPRESAAAASEAREFGVALPSQDDVQRQGFGVVAIGSGGAAEEIFFCVLVGPDGQGLVALRAVLGRGPGFHGLHGLHLFLFPFRVFPGPELGSPSSGVGRPCEPGRRRASWKDRFRRRSGLSMTRRGGGFDDAWGGDCGAMSQA